jgi:hypothetical protein
MPRPSFTMDLPLVWQRRSPLGSTSVVSGQTSDGVRTSETVVGTSRHKPQVKWISPTAYQMTWRTWRKAEGTCLNQTTSDPNGLGQFYSGCVGGSRFNSLDHFNATVLESQVTDTSLENACLIEARTKLKKTDVNLGVAFAERNATARLLGDTASRMGKAFNNLKRGRVRSAMNYLGISHKSREPRGSNVPNKWLELQYGWKPLISDVYGACNALSKRDKSDWRVTAKASRTSRQVWTATFSNTDAGIGVAQSDTYAFVRIDALPENELIISLASLGITNPLLIAWELVPYSFVVDWALPVGTWLDSIDAMLGYQNASSSRSVLTRANWEETGIRTPTNPSGGYVENKYRGYKKLVKLIRNVGGVPLPTFPRIKDPRSLGHMANGLALLASAFGRR